MYKRYKKEPSSDVSNHLNSLYPEEVVKGRNIKEITFQVTEDCCMRCTYCYQHNKTHHKMTFEIAKKFIDKMLNDEYKEINRNNTFGVVFSFIGGEPLMEIKLINQIWTYFIEQMIEKQHPWLFHSSFSICSNGLLYLNQDVQNFINRYHTMGGLTFSIDGNKELHDACRIDLVGNGTYDRAVMAMKDYIALTGKMPSTKMTLSPDNIYYTKEAVINLIDLGYTDIFLNCVFEKGWTYEHSKILYQQLKELSNYIIDNNLYDKIYISMLDENLFDPMDENNNENYCGGIVGKNYGFSIDYKGDIYPCVRYMESSLNGKQKPLVIGNINDGQQITKDQKENYKLLSNITRRSQSTDKCFYCPIANGCSWCSGYCYEENGTPNKRTTYICEMHQARALANCYYWNKVYKKVGIDKVFINYVPKDWALNIINEQEWEELDKWQML